ncbi:MAG: nucleotide exchange factor GrpE [Treponemataceae bacterium]
MQYQDEKNTPQENANTESSEILENQFDVEMSSESSDLDDSPNSKKDDDDVETDDSVESAEIPNDPPESCEQTANDDIEKKYAELKNAYLLKAADFDNYRKRMIKEKQEAFDYANTAILTDLITILDDFDRGLVAANDAQEVKSVVEGIHMINKQMYGVLESKYNLAAYGEVGDAFDPNIHEALSSTPADVEEPICAEIYLKGYKLKERVIRPAKVMVNMPQ